MSVRSMAVITATMLALQPSPGATQDQPTDSLLNRSSLSEALDRPWQPLSAGDSLERQQRRRSLLGDIAGDYQRFFGRRETYLTLGLGLAGSLSMKPFDKRIENSGFNLELPQNEDGTPDWAFDPGTLLGGSFVQVGSAFAIYGAGYVVRKPGVAALGRDLVRAQLLTQGVTQLLKYSVRRTRPDGSSRSWYPSGHASSTLRQRDCSITPLRMESRNTCLWRSVVCGSFSVGREQTLFERRHPWCRHRHNGWPHCHVR